MGMVTMLRHLNDSDSSPFYKELQAGMADGSLHNLVSTARCREGDLHKRVAALEALASEDMPCFISDLLVTIARDGGESDEVRGAAVRALTHVPNRASVAKLFRELEGQDLSDLQAA